MSLNLGRRCEGREDMSWRALLDGPASGHWNMAVDEAILEANIAGVAPPTVRLYSWRPPAVSIGYFQSFAKTVNVEACTKEGVQWVRRPTGGRAVLHDKEITYSVVFPQSAVPEDFGGGVAGAYKWIASCLLRAFEILGVDVRLQPARKRALPSVSAACFDSPSWYEVVSGTRKVVGSAQTRRQGVVLQHGSIPLRFDPERVAACLLCRENPGGKGEVARYLKGKAAGLEDLVGRALNPREVEEALLVGFERGIGDALVFGSLTSWELGLAEKLVRDKYEDNSWTRLR